MSIAHVLNFTRRPWNMSPAGELPVLGMPGGYWTASGDDEGDASGGVISFQHIFSNPVGIDRRDNNYYSLEEISIVDGLATAHEYHMEIIQMDSDTLNLAQSRPVERHYTINAQGHGVTGTFPHAINLWRARQSKVFIGRFHGIDTEFGAILVETDNIGAAARMLVVLQGLWWPPGAGNGPRGIIRPNDTIYGA